MKLWRTHFVDGLLNVYVFWEGFKEVFQDDEEGLKGR